MNTQISANVRYFSVARDEYEAGNCPVCARCGANMRHVTEINGQTYGHGCGEIVLTEMRRAESKRNALLDKAAQKIVGVYEQFPRWTVEHIQARIQSCGAAGRFESQQCWQALLEAKML